MASLKTEDVQRFKGGRIQIENANEGHLYYGQVETIHVDEGDGEKMLVITFTWLAEGQGYPPTARKWVVKRDLLTYDANLEIYQVKTTSSHCITLTSWMNVDEVTLHVPSCAIIPLNPSDVEGL